MARQHSTFKAPRWRCDSSAPRLALGSSRHPGQAAGPLRAQLPCALPGPGGTGHWNALAIDVLTFFTGGVFLGAGMLHMLPEAARQAREAGITSPLLNP